MRDSETVVIVAAGTAWLFYRMAAGYVCQPGRTFRNAGRMGFYSRRQVHGVAARIERILPSVELSSAEAARRGPKRGQVNTVGVGGHRDDLLQVDFGLSSEGSRDGRLLRPHDTLNGNESVHHVPGLNYRLSRLGFISPLLGG